AGKGMRQHDKACFGRGFSGADVNIHIEHTAEPVPATAASSGPSGPCASAPKSILPHPSTFGFLLTSKLASRTLDAPYESALRQPCAHREPKVTGVNRLVLCCRMTTALPTTARAQAVARSSR